MAFHILHGLISSGSELSRRIWVVVMIKSCLCLLNLLSRNKASVAM